MNKGSKLGSANQGVAAVVFHYDYAELRITCTLKYIRLGYLERYYRVAVVA